MDNEALTRARTLAHPFSRAQALDFTAVLHHFRREAHVVQEQAEAEIALATEYGFPFWVAGGTMRRGWALAAQGCLEEGVALQQQGLTVHRATGAETSRSYFLAQLAETYGAGGQVQEGLRVLAKALALTHKNGEYWYVAELYRLQGRALLETLA